MPDKTIFKIEDGDYSMELIKKDFPDQVRLKSSKKGTGLSEKDVVKIIAVLSNWLNNKVN